MVFVWLENQMSMLKYREKKKHWQPEFSMKLIPLFFFSFILKFIYLQTFSCRTIYIPKYVRKKHKMCFTQKMSKSNIWTKKWIFSFCFGWSLDLLWFETEMEAIPKLRSRQSYRIYSIHKWNGRKENVLRKPQWLHHVIYSTRTLPQTGKIFVQRSSWFRKIRFFIVLKIKLYLIRKTVTPICCG